MPEAPLTQKFGQTHAFLPELDRLMTSGLITLENVRVLQYGANRRKAGI